MPNIWQTPISSTPDSKRGRYSGRGDVAGYRQLQPYTIPGAVFADERQLAQILASVPRDRSVVIYCACPDEVSAAWLAARMRERGYRDVRPLLGGLDAWRDAGRPVTSLVPVTVVADANAAAATA